MCTDGAAVDGEKSVVQPSKADLSTDVPDSQLWIIRGQRYDLRSFVANHPGGSHAILLAQGQSDCTQMFDMYHPFTQAPTKLLAQHIYHSTKPTEPDCFKVATPFYDDAKAAARKLFSPRGNESNAEVRRNSKATLSAWLQHAIGLLATGAAFWRWCQGDILAVLYFPVIYYAACSALMHNGSHFCMASNVWVNLISTYLGCFHVQYDLWAYQHVVAHHVHTNVQGKDPDVHHFNAELDRKDGGHMGYRTHPDQPSYSQYKWCWKYGLFHQMLGTTAAIALLNVAKYCYTRRIQVVELPRRVLPSILIDRALLLTCIVMFCWYRGPAVGLSLIFPSWCVHGCLFNLFSQMTHINELSFGEKTASDAAPIEWAEHQVRTGADYNCDSSLWAHISMNLNNQIVHHLFPSVHPCHYPALRHALIPVCAKHGIDYVGRSSATFPDMIRGYLGYISKLNRGPSKQDWMQSNIYGISYSIMLVGFMFVLPFFILSSQSTPVAASIV